MNAPSSSPVTPIIKEGITGHQRHVGYVAKIYPDRTDVHLTPDETHMNRQDVIHGGRGQTSNPGNTVADRNHVTLFADTKFRLVTVKPFRLAFK